MITLIFSVEGYCDIGKVTRGTGKVNIMEKIYQIEVFLNNSGLSVIPMKDSDLEVYFDSKREAHLINDSINIILIDNENL